MVRRRKRSPSGEDVQAFLKSRRGVDPLSQTRDVEAWQADRARRGNPAYGNSYGGGGNATIQPTIKVDPVTGEVTPVYGAQPSPNHRTGGAGSVQAADAVAATKASGGATSGSTTIPGANPLLPQGVGTPAQQLAGKDMLAQAAAQMRGFVSQAPPPPGFFEEHFSDKAAGKALDSATQQGAYRLSSIMDYEDEKDLHLGAVNLSPVETIWDGFLGGFTTVMDTAAWAGSGAMLAANPHYWENRGELGNLWQDATKVSPGRALSALASPVQDAMGVHPGMFLPPVAGPLTQMIGDVVGRNMTGGEEQGVYSANPDFNIANDQQREEWFGNTPQKIGSGTGDAALGMVLDPTIVMGKFGQLARLRFLDRGIAGAADVTRVGRRMESSHVVLDGFRNTVDDAGVVTSRNIEDLLPDEIAAQNIDEYSRLAYLSTARKETDASAAVRASIEAETDADVQAARMAEFTPQYEKRFGTDVIGSHHLMLDATNQDAAIAALHNAQTFEQAQLIVRHMTGDAGAAQALDALAPELYKHMVDGERALIQKMVRADPELVTREVAKWQDREQMLVKRIDDLMVMQADDEIIGRHRAMLSDLQDAIDYALRAEKSPVGAGPKPSQAEIDLARRAVDAQLENNYLFERAFFDAEGGQHLFGSMGSRTKGTVDLMEGIDAGSTFGKGVQAVERGIQNSRIARAQRRAAVQGAENLVGAGKVGWAREFYGVDRKVPFARISAIPMRVAGVLEAGARYGWVEKPSGLVHTAGVTAQESAREIRAVTRTVSMFHQEARQGRNELGQALFRTKGGKVTTEATGAKGVANEPLMVGGKEHGERLVQEYLNAMLMGGREGRAEAKRIIDQFEEGMVQAVARYHGISEEKLRSAHYRINQRLEKIGGDIKDQRYWVDGKAPTQNYAPWLETHLENSTFMKNWHEIDKAASRLSLQQRATREGATAADQMKWRGTAGADFMENLFDDIDGGIQSIWRPLVLARGGYTIRNTMEGLFRSSAYLFSAGPVLDATKQLGLSTGNVTKRAVGVVRRADRNIEAAKAGAGFSDMSRGFQRWRNREVNTATTELEATRSIITRERVQLAEQNAAYRLSRMRWLDQEQGRVAVQSEALRDKIAEIEADSFWQSDPAKVALHDRAQAQVDLNDVRFMDLQDEYGSIRAMTGGSDRITPDERALADTLDHLDSVDIPYREAQLTALSDPTLAAQAYRRQTAARRRVYGRPTRQIADTDTMASLMRGRALTDPFAPDDPYMSLALQNLSADGTVRQTAAMRMKAITGGMAAYEMRHYVNVNPGDANYFDGVATALNQIMNSDIGQIIIRGRAADRFDEDIAMDIARYLYSDEGATTATILNEANEGLFSEAGRFKGLSEQTREATALQVRENTPLYEALDTAQDELRTATSIAGDARWRMNRLPNGGKMPPARRTFQRQETDSPGFKHYVYGDTSVYGYRGNWTASLGSGGIHEFKSEKAARAAAKSHQDILDEANRKAFEKAEPVEVAGHKFTSHDEIDAYLASARETRDKAAAALAKAESQPVKIKGTGPREHVGKVLTPETIRKRMDNADSDMWDAMDYAREVIRRYEVVTGGNKKLQAYIASIEQLPMGPGHKPSAAGDIMRSFLTDENGVMQTNLEPIVGNVSQWVGANSITKWWHGKTQKMFRYIGTIPEDMLVRAPFYGRNFQDEASRLYDILAAQRKGGTISLNDVNTIREMAHRRALKETKQWLYTIDRRTTFADAAERVLPFASAMQNGVTAVGRLAWHDPAIPAVMAKLWHAPDKAGWTDEKDNVHVPIGWVPSGVRDLMGLTDEEFVFNKQSADLLTQGLLEPSAPPLISLPASELMKNSFFGTGLVTAGTPGWLQPFGETGDAIWDGWNAYMFGEGFGASQEFASWDKAAPPWISRLVKGVVEGVGSSAAYGRSFSTAYMLDAQKVANGEKDQQASFDEIANKTTAMTVARSLAQLIFLPVAPKYPVSGTDIGVPEAIQGKVQAAGLDALGTVGNAIRTNDQMYFADRQRIADVQRRMDAGEMVDPSELMPRVQPSEELFGEAVWRAYKVAAKDNVAGFPSTVRAQEFVMANQSLLRDVAPTLKSHDMLDVLGMFATDPNAMYEKDPYDPNVTAYFTSQKIPGTNEEYVQPDDPQASIDRATVSQGWGDYLRKIDALEIDARRNGVEPPFSSASTKEAGYYNAKKQIEAYVGGKYKGWDADKRQRDSKTDLTAEIIEQAMRDPGFQKSMVADPVWRKGGYADVYVTERRIYRNSLDSIRTDMRANGVMTTTDGRAQPWIDMQSAAKQRWFDTQNTLRTASPSWQAIQDRYLGEDEDPGKMSESIYGLEEAS